MEGVKGKGGERYRLQTWYTGTTSTKNDVSIALDKSLKDGMVDIKHQGDNYFSEVVCWRFNF
jgi:hypothetical protein